MSIEDSGVDICCNRLLDDVQSMRNKLTDGHKSRREMSYDLQRRQLELSRLRVQLIRLQQSKTNRTRTKNENVSITRDTS